MTEVNDPTGGIPAFERIPTEPTTEPSPEYLAKLVFLSYRLSQGGIGTQARMLLYIEDTFYPDMFSDRMLPSVREAARDMVGRFFLNPKSHPAAPYTWEGDAFEESLRTPEVVSEEVAGVFEQFIDRSKIDSFDFDLVSIAQSVIVMDYDYLTREGGRAGDSESLLIRVHPYQRDPYESWLVKYGVIGETTHSTEYDSLFSQLGTKEVIQGMDSHAQQQLLLLLQIYCREHPEIAHDERILARIKWCQESLDG